MRYIVAVTLVFALASPALAHRLHCDPKLDGDRLRVEAFYEDGTPAQEAKVRVLLAEVLIADGRTDEKGVWSCPRPAPGIYIVRVESVGHAANATIEIQPPAAADATDDSSSRTEKTGTQWGKLALGLAIITGLFGAWFVARTRTKTVRLLPK
jgi:nickel transport protein